MRLHRMFKKQQNKMQDCVCVCVCREGDGSGDAPAGHGWFSWPAAASLHSSAGADGSDSAHRTVPPQTEAQEVRRTSFTEENYVTTLSEPFFTEQLLTTGPLESRPSRGGVCSRSLSFTLNYLLSAVQKLLLIFRTYYKLFRIYYELFSIIQHHLSIIQ